MQEGKIEQAGEKDITELELLVNSTYRGDTARKGWTHEADLLGGQRIDQQGIRELVENKNITLLKYSENGRIVACVSLEKKGDHLYLGMLTVDPLMQGKGTGKLLLKKAEEFARTAGTSVIEMTVITARTELIEWYERHGYKNTGEIRSFPLHDVRFGIPATFLEFVVLEKKL